MAKHIYFAGRQVWSESLSTGGRFLFQDHLGSTRVAGDEAGNLLDDMDYLPFGSLAANYGAAPSDNHYVFTGYESDSEDSTDYAIYRNLSTSMGRFNRPDPYMGSYDFTNPQSLNRYSYVQNNPLRYADPTGLSICYVDQSGGGGDLTPVAVEDAEACDDMGGILLQNDETVNVNSGPDGTQTTQVSVVEVLVDPANSSIITQINLPSREDYMGNYPGSSYTSLFCMGDALAAKGVSIALDGAGAIPIIGNFASAASIVMSVFDDSPISAGASGVDVGLKVADASLGGTKVIPGIGNYVAVGTAIYDVVGAVKTYQACMNSGKYD